MLWVEREIQIDKCIYSVNYLAINFIIMIVIFQTFKDSHKLIIFIKIIKNYKN